MPTTSWSHWSKTNWAKLTKRTINFLFYLLAWSRITQAGREELYFIAIDTSIWICARVNIIRIQYSILYIEIRLTLFETSICTFTCSSRYAYFRQPMNFARVVKKVRIQPWQMTVCKEVEQIMLSWATSVVTPKSIAPWSHQVYLTPEGQFV